jgi:hypothetical protein
MRFRLSNNLAYLVSVSRHFLVFQIVVLASGVGPDFVLSVPRRGNICVGHQGFFQTFTNRLLVGSITIAA